ncbi:MAG: PEP-CTERM sorting domain-containing protein [Phycisphaerae bacterium]|nr:PEP-CTERM sorting domain-containing protein [Phycisphaerae bacterium]
MRKNIVLSLVVLLALSFSAQAYFVGNHSFEEPGTGTVKNWNDVPFWSSDRVQVDSGVESNWPGATDGDYSGFLMAGDPSVWQLTSTVIEAGQEYTLLVDARNNYTAIAPAKMGMMLYYDDMGSRMPVALAIVDLLGDGQNPWATYSLSFIANDVPISIGKQIGIEFVNVSAQASWIGIDNVRLVPEPMTLVLLGLGGLFLRKRR